jgi:hypothetical protein
MRERRVCAYRSVAEPGAVGEADGGGFPALSFGTAVSPDLSQGCPANGRSCPGSAEDPPPLEKPTAADETILPSRRNRLETNQAANGRGQQRGSAMWARFINLIYQQACRNCLASMARHQRRRSARDQHVPSCAGYAANSKAIGFKTAKRKSPALRGAFYC